MPGTALRKQLRMHNAAKILVEIRICSEKILIRRKIGICPSGY
jgi:hypothetical protein